MPEMNIELEGRKLVETVVHEQTAEKIVSTSKYDDGTEITFHQTAEGISVSSNRTFEVQPDGVTVKIK